MNGHREITGDEALMWLNDHAGQSVNLVLYVDRGDYNASPLGIGGELHHAPPSPLPTGAARDEVAGLYYVGEASLDVSDCPDDAFRLFSERELRVNLDENTELAVIRPLLNEVLGADG